jgi:uncharacterized protein YecE (DUF72 family)
MAHLGQNAAGGKNTTALARVGIGGWTYAPWRGRFYPKGLKHADELGYAAGRLTSIEINGTFYRHQTPADFAAWRDAVPDGFVFAVKAHRAATHGKAPEAAIARFLESGVAELGAKLGPILWQFPYNRRFDAELCGRFLAALPKTLRHAVEARHPSFAAPAWLAMLREAGVASVIVDSDKQALHGDLTAGFVYARLQRNAADAPEGYDGAALDAWAARIAAWRDGKPVADLPLLAAPASPEPRPCFIYCIAGDKDRAPDAAQALLRRLGAAEE